jgi:hypothetical protein
MAKGEGKKTTPEAEHEHIDVGNVIVTWETWEFPPTERSNGWYVAAGSIGLAMLLYALMTANFVFALILLMFAVILLMRDIRKPARVRAYVTTSGVVFGDEFYPYEKIKDFSISYSPPDVKYLYVAFQSRVQPTLSIHLDDVNPNDVRQALLPYVFENLDRDGESLTDTLRRVYKL